MGLLSCKNWVLIDTLLVLLASYLSSQDDCMRGYTNLELL